MDERGPKIGKRHLEAISFFFAVFIGFCTRVNISLTIVAMTDPNANPNKDIPTFNWNNRNVILSAFFWGYVIPQLPAGWLMNRYGAKWFLIASMVLDSLVLFLTPPAAINFGSTAVIICRVIQGFCQGFLIPSVPCFMSKWVPENERGRLGTFVFAAGPLGTVFSMVASGAISDSSYGWPLVYYLFSILGICWSIFYAIFGKNSPAEHPSITLEEKNYIEKTSSPTRKTPLPTPWKKILSSIPFYALLYSYTGFIFGYWVLLTQIPTFMSKILKIDLTANGLLSGLPYITQWLIGLVLSVISDQMTNKKIITISTARKCMTSIGMVCPALALIFLGQCTEETITLAVTLLILAIGFNGASYCGTFINNNDLSPNHAGVIYGIVNGFSNLFAILAPLIVQLMISDVNNPQQWNRVFFLASAVYASGAIVFCIFGSGEIQSWNEPRKEDNEEPSNTK